MLVSNPSNTDQWICQGFSTKHGNFIIKKTGGYCADPFFLTSDIVVFEFFSYEFRRGWIEAYNITESKSYKIFDNYKHSSFPFVFYFEENLYIVPEQWRCKVLHALPIVFDNRNQVSVNEKLAVRLSDNISAVDSMLYYHEGNLICLYNEDEGFIGDPGGVLSVSNLEFLSDGMDEASKSIICTDFRVSRNAGSVWICNDEIVRTYQKKNSGSYGDGVGLHYFSLSVEKRNDNNDGIFKDLTGAAVNCNSHHLDLFKPHMGVVWDLKS